MNETVNRSILLTGAAGRIGSAFYRMAPKRFQFRLADRDIASLDEKFGAVAETISLDVADLDACRVACTGVDTVVHLAADPSPDATFYGTLLDSNIKGTFNIFRAAKDAGCRRLVFASSAQTVEGYPEDRQISVRDPLRPKNLYGVTKCFGEALASYFATQEGLSAIAVRIANFAEFSKGEYHSPRDISAFLSPRDAVQLLTKAIDVENVEFAIVNGISNNRYKRLSLDESCSLLGYAPLDDAFEIIGL